jgi:hypothetical protein
MSYKLTAYAAVTAILLASSPCSAISIVIVPTNSDGTPRFKDPDTKAQGQFTGSIQTTTSQSGNSSGFGGAGTLSNRTFNSGDRAPSNIAPTFSSPGFVGTAPNGSNLTDPTFGPQGVYTPGLHGNTR